MDIGVLPSATIGSFPCSLAQQRFWLIDALDPGTAALNVAVRWTLRGAVSPARVELAFQRIVARHEILRTAIVEMDGVPTQCVSPELPFRITTTDLRQHADPWAEAARHGEAEARTPFRLDTAPLLRVALLLVEAETSLLLVTLHHAASDGWSIGVIAREFMAGMADAPAELLSLPLQYGDYAEWQQAWLASTALGAAQAYWTQQLRQLPYVEVAPDMPRGRQRSGAGAIASMLLPRTLTDAMQARAAAQGCTLFAVALAGLGSMLGQRTGAEDIAIGTQIAGRDETELEGMIGPFINTLVLRLDLSGEPTTDALIARMAGVVQGALDHHAMPFETLIRVLNPPRERNRTPLFAVNFIFQRSFIPPAAQDGLALVDMPSHSAGALYDLNFFMVERPDGWRASCEYDAALYRPETVQSMLAAWEAALAGWPAPLPAPAEDEVEARLRAIWQEVLGVPEIAVSDGFFDLGGHSLLAARMLARVEAAFGRRIGLADLFQDSSLGGLAGLLRRDAPAPLVGIGEVAVLTAVAERLGRDAFAAPRCEPLGSIELIAAAQVAAIEALHPRGPLVLVGQSGHGLVALEAARQLRAGGREVPLLVVLDGAPDGPGRVRAALQAILPRVRATPGGEVAAAVAQAYRPAPYDGRVLLLQCGATRDDRDWSALVAGTLETLTLPGNADTAAIADRIIASLS